jgi:hypothetical protein
VSGAWMGLRAWTRKEPARESLLSVRPNIFWHAHSTGSCTSGENAWSQSPGWFCILLKIND